MKTRTNLPTIIGILIYLIYSFVDSVICRIPYNIKIPVMAIGLVLLTIGLILEITDIFKEKKRNNKII
jgi:cbb3-type cytochrome oxidase subunit 1